MAMAMDLDLIVLGFLTQFEYITVLFYFIIVNVFSSQIQKVFVSMNNEFQQQHDSRNLFHYGSPDN